jgi:hypothetical protein
MIIGCKQELGTWIGRTIHWSLEAEQSSPPPPVTPAAIGHDAVALEAAVLA